MSWRRRGQEGVELVAREGVEERYWNAELANADLARGACRIEWQRATLQKQVGGSATTRDRMVRAEQLWAIVGYDSTGI
jgi:hypothetical protein